MDKAVELANGAMKALGSEDTSKAIENVNKLKDIIHTSQSSQYIGDVKEGRGFKSLQVVMAKTKGRHRFEQMDEVVERLMKPFVAREVPSNNRNVVIEDMDSMIGLIGSGQEYSTSSITFQNGHGQCLALIYGYRKVGDTDDYDWFVFHSSAAFTLMPDYVIVRHTKSNFFRSKTRDEIKYIDRGVNPKDMADLVAHVLVLHQGAEQVCLPAITHKA